VELIGMPVVQAERQQLLQQLHRHRAVMVVEQQGKLVLALHLRGIMVKQILGVAVAQLHHK
jgi:hypothetical protein